jgi:lipoate-protein ligase A
MDELTYSIIVPSTDGLRPAVRSHPARTQSPIINGYRNVSLALINALHRVQLREAESTAHIKNRTTKGTVCFTIPADYEITVRGRKLTGHAQMHIRGGILQHGTIPLTGDLGRISQFLQDRPDPQTIRARAITLEEALGRPVSWEELARAMLQAFASTFNVDLKPGELLPLERTEVQRLITEKYGNFKWTAKI